MFLGNNGFILFKDKTLEEVQKEQREESRETIVLTALKFIFKFAKLRLSSGISVWKFSSEHSLISSDNPVVFIGNNPEHVAPIHPNNCLSIPLDSEHLLRVMPVDYKSNPTLIYRCKLDDELSYFESSFNNLREFENADKFVIGKEISLKVFLADKDFLMSEEFFQRLKIFYEKKISILEHEPIKY